MNVRCLFDGLPHVPLDRRNVACPTYDRLLTGSERLREQGSNPTFLRFEIDIVRTHGQAVPLSDCLAYLNRYTEIEILRKCSNQYCLLIIFLAEQGEMGLHHSEE